MRARAGILTVGMKALTLIGDAAVSFWAIKSSLRRASSWGRRRAGDPLLPRTGQGEREVRGGGHARGQADAAAGGGTGRRCRSSPPRQVRGHSHLDPQGLATEGTRKDPSPSPGLPEEDVGRLLGGSSRLSLCADPALVPAPPFSHLPLLEEGLLPSGGRSLRALPALEEEADMIGALPLLSHTSVTHHPRPISGKGRAWKEKCELVPTSQLRSAWSLHCQV